MPAGLLPRSAASVLPFGSRLGRSALRYQYNIVTNPREDHLAWDGKVLATDDPWWNTHYPPNGWGCRCTVTGVGKGRMRALGKDGPDPTPAPSDGDPPPEWAYHPGKAATSLPAAASFGEKVMALPPDWRTIALDDAQRRDVDWFGDWPGFVGKVRAEIAAGAVRPQGTATPLGFLPAPTLDVLASGRALNGRTFAPVAPHSTLIAATDRLVYHALRDAKFRTRPALRAEVAEMLERLPSSFGGADAVLWDPYSNPNHPLLWFAHRRPAGDYIVVGVRPDYREPRANEPATAAWVRTVEERTATELRALPLVAGALI